MKSRSRSRLYNREQRREIQLKQFTRFGKGEVENEPIIHRNKVKDPIQASIIPTLAPIMLIFTQSPCHKPQA